MRLHKYQNTCTPIVPDDSPILPNADESNEEYYKELLYQIYRGMRSVDLDSNIAVFYTNVDTWKKLYKLFEE